MATNNLEFKFGSPRTHGLECDDGGNLTRGKTEGSLRFKTNWKVHESHILELIIQKEL